MPGVMSKTTVRNPKCSRKTLFNIVQEVRKRPCLWNPDDLYHNNRARVAVAWEEVSATLKIPEPLIKAKWKIMRDIFKREMKRCKANSKGEYQYEGKWRHFKIMWFMHKPKAKLIYYDPTEDSNGSAEQETIKEEKLDDDTDADELPNNNISFERSNILSIDFEPEQDQLPRETRQYPEDDYDSMFLKSLVPYFKNLDPVRKLRIRNMIQDVIINEIIATTQ